MSPSSPTDLLFYPSVDLKPQDASSRPGVSRSEKDASASANADRRLNGATATALLSLPAAVLNLLTSRLARPPQPPPRVPPIAWHPSQPRLAVADESGCVQVFDVTPSGGAFASGEACRACLQQPCAVQKHQDFQNIGLQVLAIEYRPHGGGLLAAAGDGCVAIWDASQPSLAAGDAGSGCRIWRPERATQIASLAWNPTGSLLAGGHGNSAGFTVWDAALGTPTTVSAGWEPVTLLSWSPNGSYLLTAGLEGSFTIWDTERWNHENWKTAAAGRLLAAKWSPDSKCLLLAFANSSQLTALCLVSQAPSLKAQLLPVELPGYAGQGVKGEWIAGFEWDRTGERLAVVCGAAHPDVGKVALFATVSKPVVTAHFLGLISPGAKEGLPTVHFHPRCHSGALLAVRSGKSCVNVVPLLFTPSTTY